MAVLEEIPNASTNTNTTGTNFDQMTTEALKREVERLEKELKQQDQQEKLNSMKQNAVQKRFQEARELAMEAKFRPARLRTEMKDEEIEERGKGVVFGEIDATDEKNTEELEKQGVAVVEMSPSNMGTTSAEERLSCAFGCSVIAE